MDLIFDFHEEARRAIAAGADVERVSNLPVRERIGRAKAVPYHDCAAEFSAIKAAVREQLGALISAAQAEN